MSGQLEIIKRQQEQGIFPHAYLFSGNDVEAKDAAVKFLVAKFIGENYLQSPDFFRIDSKPITIEEIRALKDKASQSPLAGDKNVFLINNIENLSREAAPALLKLLEEPALSCIIIATTGNVAALLDTIKSRFSVFRFYRQYKLDAPVAGDDEFRIKLANALTRASRSARISPVNFNILKFERLLKIYKVIGDPTINKRLLGEYLTMVS